ncbi:MAG: DMT family transporter [Pseudomonadota bacterium]
MTVSTAEGALTPRGWLGPALLFVGALCIGFAPIGLRLSEMGPQATALWRYVFALPLLFVLVLAAERRLPAAPNRFAVLAGIFFALDVALWHWGLTLTTVANATFIVNLGNICVGFVAWLIFGERPSRVWGAAVLVALIGAALLSQGGGADGQADIRGDALALGAAVLVGGYMLCAQLARRSLSALDALFWMTAVQVVVALAVTLAAGETLWPQTASAWWPLIFLGLVAHVAGQGLIVAGLGRTSAAVAGIIVLAQPVMAAAVSWRLFGETLAGLQIFGAGMILAAVYLAQAGQNTSKPSQ